MRKVYCAELARPEPDCDDCGEVGNPIHPSAGVKRQVETDYEAADGTLRFARTYRSDRNGWRHNYQVAAVDVSSSFGTPSHSAGACKPGVGLTSGKPYCFRYISRGSPSDIALLRADGRVVYFSKVTGLPTSANVNERMTPVLDGGGALIGWDIRDGRNDSVQRLSPSGQLQMILHRDGRTETLAYSDATTPSTIAPFAGLLISVSDQTGAQLTFTYDAQGRMATMTDPSGGIYSYAYDEPSSVVLAGKLPVGNLTSVTYPDQTKRTYWYNEQDETANNNQPFALTGITDEAGNRYATFSYNSSGRAIATEHAGGVERYSFTYSGSNASVTDPLGTVRTHTYSTVLGLAKSTSINKPCTGATCGGNPAATTTYDANGNVASRTDFNGRKVCYAHDLSRNLEVVRLEGVASGVSCPANLSYYVPAVGTRQRKIVTQWHASYRLPTQIDELGKRTTFTHDVSGNVLTRTDLDTTTSESRIWTYTYNSFGKVLTADGPRTDVSDVTTYTYYGCTTGYQCGQVQTVTNAAGHVTTFNSYNAHGQPLTITDPNGRVTTLTYDAHRRLKSRTVGIEVTSFDYWSTGLLKKATLPDGSYLEYTYDPAHRLSEINDAEGNRIHYTLDAMGNRTGEAAYDPSNALTRTRTRVFSVLNRLEKEIGAAGTVNVTTTFGYDNNGNQTSVIAPLGRDATQGYDELNRLTSVTDALNGVTQYGYNALDQLISVTDPRGLVTSYSYNALGDLGQQTSPDTGVTSNTYDSGGNLATSTDARGAVATYTYDALNRVATAAFSSGSTTDQTLTYTYDAGTYGKGRLTGVSDADHSLSWTYDDQGRVLTAGQVVGSVSKTTSYSYANGLRQSMTTPSGQVISYSYTDGKITGISVNGTVLISNALYDPFGPVRQWTWSNGSLSVRTFDQDGKVTQIDSAGLKTYSYDDAFRITGITDTTDSALSWTYGYDDLDRLTSGSKTGTTLGYTYDANGNRLTQTGTGASTFTVAANSNRLTSTSGALARTYGYDNAGNTTSFTGITFTYNNRGRMKSSTKSGVTTNYTYNALGQLIKKGTSTLYYYDEAGHIIGIYTGSGALTEEIVWLGDTPIISLRPKVGGGINIYNIHTDHLNTPRLIVGSVNPGVRWRWDADPFGGGTVSNNPSGVGVFNFDLRFPGQIAMAETGLNYNYLRDYDPNTGRYIQSDPIGLRAGINTYAYVSANPISLIDRFGLQGFDPGRWPEDPTPDNRDPRTPWQPPGASNRDLCDPYWRVTVEFNGQQNTGLIPLVSEEVVSEDGCHKTVLCTYTGRIFVNVRWGEASADSREMVVTKFKTRKK
ncbi:RHS repeat protein [Peristeroidobacter soli]|uniref:RHS repeat protein n=1 Tax=Peristeroidobacter soli TaxID=2497877 RepID=UPI00158B6BA5|nr:RHS repeat protein [Peristeroidobacter soli]